MIDTKDILYKYFELHEKPSSIAKELNVVPSYVTKVVQKDDRYNEEKEYRLNLSKEKRQKDKRDWIRKKRQNEALQIELNDLKRSNTLEIFIHKQNWINYLK